MLRLSRGPYLALLLIPALSTCGGGDGPTGPGKPVPTALSISAPPPGSVANDAPFQVTVHVVSATGTAVAVPGVAIIAKVVAGGQMVSGDTAEVTDTDGVAHFSPLRLHGLAGQVQLRFEADSLSPAVSGPFTLTAGTLAQLELVAGDAQTATVHSVLPVAITVRATDQSGNPVPGATLRFSVVAGGGSLDTTTAASTRDLLTSATGMVVLQSWRLGTVTGTNQVQVTAFGLPAVAPVTLTAIGKTGAATAPTLVTTFQGTPRVDSDYVNAFVAHVTDAYGNPVPGRPVTFTTTLDAGGTLSGASGVTDASGDFSLADWHTGTHTWDYFHFIRATTPEGFAELSYMLRPGPFARVIAVTPQLYAPRNDTLEVGFRTVDRLGNGVELIDVDAAVTSGASPQQWSGQSQTVGIYQPTVVLPGAAGDVVLHAASPLLPDSGADLTIHVLAPVAILPVAGDSQSGTSGTAFPIPPKFRVVDTTGAGVGGVPVLITEDLGNGGGAFGAALTSDSDGYFQQALQFGGTLGVHAIYAYTSWLPADTAKMTYTTVVGPVAAVQPIYERGPFPVAAPAESAGVFRVVDSWPHGIPGAVVHFTTASGSFPVDSAIADSGGYVAVPTWIPGTVAGTVQIFAHAGGHTGVLSVQVKAGAPASLTLAPGLQAEGFAAEPLATPVRLIALDQYGNRVVDPGAGTVSVTAGGGTAAGLSVSADSEVVLWNWTLGPTPGLNQAQITVGSANVTVSVDAPAASPFNIVLRGVPEAYAGVFGHAVYEWRRRITADIPDVAVSIPAAQCAPFQQAYDGTIDDLIIDVSIGGIDGPGGILGGATPCFIRTTGKLPLLGVMQFDDADLAVLAQDGTLDDVILHEMGHVLGIGSLWSTDALVNGAGGADPRYHGTGGEFGWNLVGGVAPGTDPTVPVENTGGSGTRDVHWRETSMPSELMTGYLSAAVNPMSAVTIYALSDLGYTVDPSTADPYAAFTAPPVTSDHRQVQIQDVVHGPRFTIDEHGKISPLP